MLSPPISVITKTILSISRDQLLLETRAAILRKSGHQVISVSDPDEFLEALQQSQIDLIVLGHSLLPDDREEAFRFLSETGCSSPVIELYATTAPPKSPAHFQLAVHDRTFQTDLLALVQQVLADAVN